MFFVRRSFSNLPASSCTIAPTSTGSIFCRRVLMRDSSSNSAIRSVSSSTFLRIRSRRWMTSSSKRSRYFSSSMAAMLLLKYRERFDEDVIHRLERIRKNVQVETDLIAELLELSRIKTRRQKMEPVDVGAMVHELAGRFENDLRTKNIALVVDQLLPVLECERARIRQVFQNLIDNAIKYMGEGANRRIH